jgi:hypothetical protein
MKKKNDYPLTFELFINKKIICSRNFSVRDCCNSTDLYSVREMISELISLVERLFLENTINYLWESYDPFNATNKVSKISKANTKEDVFKINVSLNTNVLASGCFSGNRYPPKIRYNVDIRKIIPELLNVIRLYLSKNIS